LKPTFPLIEGSVLTYPRDGSCPVCRQSRVGEPHEFVGFSGGACSADEANVGEAFLDLFIHPAEDDSSRGAGAHLELVKDASHGQFDLLFCSTACLRSFFNACVDELERRSR
jgi:hypothetical protein